MQALLPGTALRIWSENPEPSSDLAAIALAKIPGRMPEALAHFQTALKLAPKDADIENAYADALAWCEPIPDGAPEYAEAVACRTRATELLAAEQAAAVGVAAAGRVYCLLRFNHGDVAFLSRCRNQ